MATDYYKIGLRRMKRALFRQIEPNYNLFRPGYIVEERIFFYKVVALPDGKFKRIVHGIFEPLRALNDGFITRHEYDGMRKRPFEKLRKFLEPYK